MNDFWWDNWWMCRINPLLFWLVLHTPAALQGVAKTVICTGEDVLSKEKSTELLWHLINFDWFSFVLSEKSARMSVIVWKKREWLDDCSLDLLCTCCTTGCHKTVTCTGEDVFILRKNHRIALTPDKLWLIFFCSIWENLCKCQLLYKKSVNFYLG